MRWFRIALFASVAACTVSAAWAQYGLYGAPETLRVPQQEAAFYETPASVPASQPSAATAGYPATNYPATAVPTTQPAPQPNYYQPAAQYPQYQPGQYPPAQYRAVQPQATAMYQPYQAGQQYRYPNPYERPAVQRMAAAGQTTVTPSVPRPSMAPANPPMVGAEYDYPPAAPVPAPQGSGVTNQMLAEQGYDGSPDNGGPYRGAVERYERAACNPGCDDCVGDSCQAGCCSPWYAGISALVLGRTDAPRVWTTYRDGYNETQLMNTQFGMQWACGGEVRLGRRFCCGCVPYAVEASYWTTEAMTGSQSCSWPGGYVSTPLIVGYINFDGTSAENWFNGAEEHRITRRDEFHNFEINLVREQLAWACDSPWDIGWSAGVRYFRFQEDLNFETRAQGCEWTDLAGTAHLQDIATNNLIGFQFGFDAAYCLGSGVRFYVSPKVGLYDNLMNTDFRCSTGDGINGSTDDYGSFPATGSANGIAFLTQIDLGADWRISRSWSARAGYRVVAITGVALADSQFPQYLNDIPDIKKIQHTDSLVLHGAFVGLTYNF